MKWLLVALIATRAIAPVGFMPNAVVSGVPFALCGGDIRSAQWLAIAANSKHHAHHHHHSEAHSFFNNLCDFAVLGLAAGFNTAVETPLLTLPGVVPNSRANTPIHASRYYQRPPARASPILIS